jgi:hypothetical protein
MENSKKEEQITNESHSLDTLKSLLSLKGQLHNHKETMAHAAVLAQLALVTALFNINFKQLCYSDDKGWILLLYFIIWSVISYYMCWQLKMRRIAQWQVNEILEAMQHYYPVDSNMYKFIKDNMKDAQEPIGIHCYKEDCKKVIRCPICCDNHFWRKGNLSEIILWIADALILGIGVLRIFSIG